MGESVHYHCDYCQKDISEIVRIRCAVCKDFDLCLHCFSVGVEIRGHKNDHAYRIIVPSPTLFPPNVFYQWNTLANTQDYTSFPLFDEGWGADEELLLLEGIQMHGMGNWTEVADHVATKSPDACRDHYITFYLNSPTCPLPVSDVHPYYALPEYLLIRTHHASWQRVSRNTTRKDKKNFKKNCWNRRLMGIWQKPVLKRLPRTSQKRIRRSRFVYWLLDCLLIYVSVWYFRRIT